MSAIQATNVQKHFGDVHVLRGIDFTIPKGQGTVLLGANGCGKSTLMRCINGLTRPDAGAIEVLGTAIQRSDRRNRRLRRQIGVVFQRFNLVHNLTAFQNVLFGAAGEYRLGILPTLSPFASNELRDRAMACLERVKLADMAHQKAEELSGGQQQRVAIARMLLQKPDMVLADEPIASLDPKAGREVMDLLWEIVDEQQLTVLCTLHQLDIATRYADHILGMKAGRIQINARTSEVDRSAMEALYHGKVRVDTPVDQHQPNNLAAAA
ncbi:ATP-binding cassette domain-containing protein [Halorhodospira halochloris]|uniref:phosphonate ABC transporter ATP-binding protein n=1 Tax=Halorhodospira halochloris TaxID=1052 RepID=UPI001EE8AFD8|nr:ATP-binding cassette domain-containing protein [Halorhodospira halochloris]MCG5530049.1 ATP-binding cassette domain-containing protein [Halorhodospira halochloris]